jgi:hypothetical protein
MPRSKSLRTASVLPRFVIGRFVPKTSISLIYREGPAGIPAVVVRKGPRALVVRRVPEVTPEQVVLRELEESRACGGCKVIKERQESRGFGGCKAILVATLSQSTGST